jgi:hypothetical protein
MPPAPLRSRRSLLHLVAVLTLLVVAACAPAAAPVVLDSPEAQALDRVAQEAFHRMEIGRLRTGSYTSNVLVDLDLPRGARVTVEAFGEAEYLLRITSDVVDGIAWLVSPRGVERVGA